MGRAHDRVARMLPGTPGITARDLALQLGQGVAPTLRTLEELRADGRAIRIVGLPDVPGDLVARWSGVPEDEEAPAS